MSFPMPSRDVTNLERQLLLDAKTRYEQEIARALRERDGLIARLADDDASVAQIAEILSMTRQGVYDAIKRGREQQ